MAEHAYRGQCTRCKAAVAAVVTITSTGEAAIVAAPVIGCWCECENRLAPDGPRAVPLTRREAA